MIFIVPWTYFFSIFIITEHVNIYYRTNYLNSVQVCNYTKKSAEEKLGLDKPKRPLTPFFKFIAQMRPALLAKNPGISSKEAIAWTSKHWQQLDSEVFHTVRLDRYRLIVPMTFFAWN